MGREAATRHVTAMKADAMLDQGDLDGAAVWRRIVAAINDIQRSELKPGERRH